MTGTYRVRIDRPAVWLAIMLGCAAAQLNDRLAASSAAATEHVSLESLLTEMIDRDRLARLPCPAYVCRQASSYDRDTVSPDQPGWFANWDRSQFVRSEENAGRREWVMLDADGPGAIVRFWGTWHGPRGGPFSNGTLRVYLDHATEPAIAGPIADVISGGALVPAPLSESVSPEAPQDRRGHNLYLPIPYARHCKVTYESDKLTDLGGKQGEALYYQINYRTYEAGAEVETFSPKQLVRLRPLAAQVGQRLTRSGVEEQGVQGGQQLSGRLAAGQSRSVELQGPAAIRQLIVRLDAADREQALRSTVLEVNCDDEQTVWCCVGDFFGTGWRIAPFRTWFTQVTGDGTMRAFWAMPFQRFCRVTIRNVGTQDVDVTAGLVETKAWTWDDQSLHFHANWRQYTQIDTGPVKDQTGQGAMDVNYITIQGQGQYVGDTLTLFNGSSAWWGEGDEKIYVDDETFPSHVGTGTEDYYGYAWCRPEPFESPFHTQPVGSGNFTVGLTVNSRYRSLDAIPFTKSLKFDMELWHWKNTRMNYAPTTFWYARPGARCNVAPAPAIAALPIARHRADVGEPQRVANAIEGESMKLVEKTGGIVEVQESELYGWSDDRQRWWRDVHAGDRLVLELPSSKPGTYRVWANLSKGPAYGPVELSINGHSAAKHIERPGNRLGHDLVDLGQFSLGEGANRLEIKMLAGSENSPRMFGLDYVRLEPASSDLKQ